MTALLTPEQIYARARSLREGSPEARCIAFHFQGPWAGPDSKDEFAFYHCKSALEVREVLDTPMDRVKVLLTDLSDQELGEDVLVRIFKRRLHTLKRGDVLRGVFSAQQIDPRIATTPGLMEALVEYAAHGSTNPATAGSLGLDAAWAFVVGAAIGLVEESPDLTALLTWSCAKENLDKYRALPDGRRQLILSRLIELGPGAEEFCTVLESGHHPVAVALVCGVVYHDDASSSLQKAEGKAEDRFFKGLRPRREGVRKLASAAESLATSDRVDPYLSTAQNLLNNLDAETFAYLSPVLPDGYEQRLARLAREMQQACRAPSSPALRSVFAARERVWRHRLAKVDKQEVHRIDMSIRLLAWQVQQEVAPSPLRKTLVHAAQEYATVWSFVDWARYSLIPGSRNRELEKAYREICQRVDAQRELFAREFARLLSGDTGAGVADLLVPIERVMRDVVAPLATANPVLVVVVDGLSWFVWRELSSSIPIQWMQMSPSKSALVALATIPSVTESSRCSLFCGELKLGKADVEVKGFKSHPDLAAAGQHNRSPKLHHKASLKSGGESGLADDVRDSIKDKSRRIVAVVVNAVDDNLLKGDQLVMSWSVESVHPLASLLEEARLAGRYVVVTGDHGHVLEIGSEIRKGSGGERWKTAETAEDGEIVIEGPRVVMGNGNRLVAPWKERIRYGPKRNGYHGGVSPQEMLIPVAVFRHESAPKPDLKELVEQLPEWWEVGTSGATIETPVSEICSKPKVLFADAAPPKSTQAKPAWIGELLKSPILKAQAVLAGRHPLKLEELTQLLTVLTARGGTVTESALARELDMLPFRIGGFVTVAQRMLNVEGFQVLSRDEESATVTLNEKLLKTQFELS